MPTRSPRSRPASWPTRRPPRHRWRCSSDADRHIYGVQFHPEVVAHGAGTGAPGALPVRRVRGPPAVDPHQHHRVGRPGRAGPGRRRPGPVRAFRWRRLGGGGRPRAPGHRRPTHVCVRRHRPHAHRRGRPGRGDVPQPVPHGPHPREGRRPVLRRPRRRDRPRGQAQGHRRDVHPGVRRGGRRRRGRPLPRPGHAVPRHHRVGHQDAATIKSHHNVGGLPEDMAFDAGGALAPAVQGRGTRRGRRARAARGDRVAPALPRARPGRPHHRGGHPRARRDPAGRRRHRHRGDPPRRALPAAVAELRRLTGVSHRHRHGPRYPRGARSTPTGRRLSPERYRRHHDRACH